MKVTPVKQYSKPNFPTRSILDERPELLRLVPKRWQRNPAVLTAIAATAALMSGVSCAAKNINEVAAPMYDRAELGGDVSVSLVIPTEADARQVICEEAKKAGINFKPDSRTIKLPGLEKKAINFSKDDDATLSFDLLMDGTDVKRNISYEYISQSDVEAWDKIIATKRFYMGRSVNDYAMHFNDVLPNATSKGYYKIFTAPAEVPHFQCAADAAGRIDWAVTGPREKAAEQQALGEAREKLREQVRDFIKWLKAEGVI